MNNIREEIVTMPRKHIRSTLVIAALSAIVIGCGGGGSSPTSTDDPPGNNTPNPPGTPTPPSSTANISISSTGDGYGGRSRSFVPSTVSITVAGIVTFTNPTDEAHNVTFAGDPPVATLQPGQSHQETFPTAGSFPFACTLHPGMSGTVTVVQ